MTDGEILFLIICGVLGLMCRRKKKPEVMFLEVFEFMEFKKRPRAPKFLVNAIIVAVIGVFIWAANH